MFIDPSSNTPTTPNPMPTPPELTPNPSPKSRKPLLITGIAIVFILLVGSFFALDNLTNDKSENTNPINQTDTVNTEQNSNETEKIEEKEAVVEEEKPPMTHTISYTNSCYSPSSLSIKNGDTVTFVNNSKLDMQPASDPHPSHTNYPEFDADNGVDPGGSWSFTFTKTGTWGFHEHYKASCKGTITVN